MPDDEKIEVTGSAEVVQPMQLNDKGRKTITAGGRNGSCQGTRWRVMRDKEVLFTADSATSLRHLRTAWTAWAKGMNAGVLKDLKISRGKSCSATRCTTSMVQR